MRLNWKGLRLAIFPVLLLLVCSGCGGFNGSHSVSPASFLLPGLIDNQPQTQPPTDLPASEEAPPQLVSPR